MPVKLGVLKRVNARFITFKAFLVEPTSAHTVALTTMPGTVDVDLRRPYKFSVSTHADAFSTKVVKKIRLERLGQQDIPLLRIVSMRRSDMPWEYSSIYRALAVASVEAPKLDVVVRLLGLSASTNISSKACLKKLSEDFRRMEAFLQTPDELFIGFDLELNRSPAFDREPHLLKLEGVSFTDPNLDRILLEEVKKFAHKMERRPRTEPPFEIKTGVPPQIVYSYTDEAITFNNTLPRGISWDFSLRSPYTEMQRVISNINRTNEGSI